MARPPQSAATARGRTHDDPNSTQKDRVKSENGPSNRAELPELDGQVVRSLTDESALCGNYGLTKIEAALVSRLVQGKPVEEIAGELRISVHTARTCLKRILAKTNTQSETELWLRNILTVSVEA